MKRSRRWVSSSEFRKNPRSDVVLQKFASGGVIKADGEVDAEDRTLKFIISDGDLDRERDTIAVDGWDLSAYKTNPVVLWAHNRDLLPIAKAVDIAVEDGRLVATAEFDDSEFASRVLSLYRRGFMSAVSVGFRPEAWKYDEQRDGYDFTKQELVEFSAVPVPANPRALVAAAAEGISLDIVRDWMDTIAKSWPDDEAPPECVSRGNRIDGALSKAADAAGDEWREVVRQIATTMQEATLRAAREAITDGTKQISEEVLARLDEIATGLAEMSASLEAIVADEGTDGEDEPDDLAPMMGSSLSDEVVRWNKSLPEDFDVTAAEIEPERKEEELAAGHCGCEIKRLYVRHDAVPSARMGGWLLALEEMIDERGDVVDVRNIDRYSGREVAPVRRSIRLNSKREGTFIVDGIRFLEVDGEKVAVAVSPTWYGLHVRTYASEENGEQMGEFEADVKVRAVALGLLRGEAFSLSGEFIERADVSMDDLFASPRNEETMRRTIDLVREDGESMESRGILLVGPPGTGKTLSGRVLMSECSEATFIWLSARDFYYGGGFRSLEEAFDIARENAPSILFIEDVDSYLTESATDFLKTAMDGLVRHEGVLTVLTSNYPEKLPAAIIDRPGRFHDVLRYDLPDDDARRRMLARWLPELEGDGLDAVVARLAGYSGAHVREFARFVSVLRAEGEIAVEDAAEKALEKIEDQRDLITAARARSYRPPAHVLSAGKRSATAEVSKGAPDDVIEVVDADDVIDLADDDVVELSDEADDEYIDVDEEAVARSMASVVREEIARGVEKETRRAIGFARGRV